MSPHLAQDMQNMFHIFINCSSSISSDLLQAFALMYPIKTHKHILKAYKWVLIISKSAGRQMMFEVCFSGETEEVVNNTTSKSKVDMLY